MIIRKLTDVISVEWGNGLSRRFLLESDGMGYSLTDTIVNKGTRSLLEYQHHLEACYCIEGRGKVIEMGSGHDAQGNRLSVCDSRRHVLAQMIAQRRLHGGGP